MPLDLRMSPKGSDFVPALRADALVRRFGSESVVWAQIRPEPAYLDPVATVMLDVLDGQASVGELVNDVHSELGIDWHTAHRQVARVVELFDRAGILESSEPLEWTWAEMRSLLPEPNW